MILLGTAAEAKVVQGWMGKQYRLFRALHEGVLYSLHDVQGIGRQIEWQKPARGFGNALESAIDS